MKCNTRKTCLCIEQLEARDLLAADPVMNALPTTNPNGASVLPGYGFPAEVSAIAAAATLAFPTPTVGFTSVPGSNIVLTGTDSNAGATSFSAPTASSGVGQMTLATGANTLGMGSFATSTLGYSSENGGRSGG